MRHDQKLGFDVVSPAVGHVLMPMEAIYVSVNHNGQVEETTNRTATAFGVAMCDCFVRYFSMKRQTWELSGTDAGQRGLDAVLG
jgi:hypothetical protein